MIPAKLQVRPGKNTIGMSVPVFCNKCGRTINIKQRNKHQGIAVCKRCQRR